MRNPMVSRSDGRRSWLLGLGLGLVLGLVLVHFVMEPLSGGAIESPAAELSLAPPAQAAPAPSPVPPPPPNQLPPPPPPGQIPPPPPPPPVVDHPPGPARPAPELDTLRFLIGSWTCTGRLVGPTASKRPRPFSAVLRVRATPGNFWHAFDYEERRSRDHGGVKLQGMWGYDQGEKKYVRSAFANNGSWEIAASAGWDGNRLIWIGHLYQPSGKVSFRHIFTKKSEREIGQSWELGDAGKSTPINEVSCRRGYYDEED